MDPGIAKGTVECGVESSALWDTKEWTFRVLDVTPPVLSFCSCNARETNENITTIKYEFNEAVTVNCTLQSLTNFQNMPCTNTSWTGLSLSDGAYTLIVQGTDIENNAASPKSVSWIVDRTGPVLLLTNTPRKLTNRHRVAFQITCSEPCKIMCSLGITHMHTSSSFTYCSQRIGRYHTIFKDLSSSNNYTFRVKGEDKFGNVGNITIFQFTTDTALSEQTTDDFRGQTTETSTIVCYNGGYASYRFGFWLCQCPFGYTGNYCENSVTTYSPCHSYPCYNGGVCYPRNYGYPDCYCSCPSGYSAKDCRQYIYQTTYDPCYSRPCQNGGTCQQNLSAYYCNCPTGYVGQHCDISSTESAVHVECADNSWNIRLYLPSLYRQYADFDPYDVYLGQDSCTGTVNGSYLLFRPDYTECDTVMKTSMDNIIYTNKLIYALHDPSNRFIVREYRFQINVDCYLLRSEENSGHFNHAHDVTSSVHMNDSAHRTVHLQFYKDSSFTQIKPLHGSRVGDTVYVKANTNVGDYNVKMRLGDCFTTPKSNSDPSLRYFIIRNGCDIDPNAGILSQSIHETRFYFQDFEYSMNHDSLYIHCNATFCTANDYSAKCEQACHNFLKRIGGGNIIKDGPFDSAEVNQALRMRKENLYSDTKSSSPVVVILFQQLLVFYLSS